MSAFADTLVADAARRCGVETGDIVGRHRQKFLVRERIAIARRLDARGYSSPRIGKVLHRDHSTILFYLGRRPNKPTTERPPVWRTPTSSMCAGWCRRTACRSSPPNRSGSIGSPDIWCPMPARTGGNTSGG